MGIVYTNTQDIFDNGGGYYAEAKYSVAVDHKNATFTVTITGVRGYVKNNTPWNFGQNITLWLGPKSDGTGAIEKKFKISASGSDSYKGYIPSSGYHSVSDCSMTFKYNSEGKAENVYICLKSYNAGVYDKQDYKTRVLSVSSGAVNISKDITDRDIRVPTFNINQTKVELTKIGVSTTPTGGFTFDSWQVQLCDDDDSKKVGPTTYNEANLSKEYTVIRPSQIVWIRGRNAYNHIWSRWQSTTFDCNKPTISNASLTPKNNNKAILSFKSDYDVYYKIFCTSPKMDTGWLGPVNVNTSPNAEITVADSKNINYTLNVKRSSNANLYNSTTLSCNTILPKLTISNLTISGTNVSFDVESDTNCNEWAVTFSNSDGGSNPVDIPDSQNNVNDPIKIKDVNTKKIHVDVTGIGININYTIKVTAVSVLNGLTGTVYEYGVKSLGAINIGDKLASVYIYNDTNKYWQGAVPLVYIDGKDQDNFPGYTDGWYMCGLNQEKFNT